MMRVEVSMDKSFRGYIEHYSDDTETTMPQAYRELLQIGLVCCNTDFDSLPVNMNEVQDLTVDEVDIDELMKANV